CASEIGSAGEAEVVREARIHVTIAVLVGNAPGIREARQVWGESAAVREDVAQVLVLHDDRDEVVEVESRGCGSANGRHVDAGRARGRRGSREHNGELNQGRAKHTEHETRTKSHGAPPDASELPFVKIGRASCR